MKVCTDATLFGAMAPIRGGESVLDIGTGTGLLTLMMAQLGASSVTAVELEKEAYEEALFNCAASQWSDRLEVVHSDIQSYALKQRGQYDFIISNPPFFEEHTKSEGRVRSVARHTDQLPFNDLIDAIAKLMKTEGLFYVLLPIHAVDKFVIQAEHHGLYLKRRVDIRGYERNEPKVSALTISRAIAPVEQELMTIYREHRVYSQQSEPYLNSFLLRYGGR